MQVKLDIVVVNDKHNTILEKFNASKPKHVKYRIIPVGEHEVAINAVSPSTPVELMLVFQRRDGYIMCFNPNESIEAQLPKLNHLKSLYQRYEIGSDPTYKMNRHIFLCFQYNTPTIDETTKTKARNLAELHQLPCYFVNTTQDDPAVETLFEDMAKACLPRALSNPDNAATDIEINAGIKETDIITTHQEKQEDAKKEIQTQDPAISNSKPGLLGLFARLNSTTEEELQNIWDNTQTYHRDNREKILAILADYTKGFFNKRHYTQDIKALCLLATTTEMTESEIMNSLRKIVTSGKIDEFKEHSELKRHIQFINLKFKKDDRVQLKKN